jgi:16S rRNA (adenine1518-N6/adenine1519-N6)-dimethyltransferase
MTCSIAHPTQLFRFLEEIDAAPRKGLSQNFLIDANIVRKIAASAVQKGDRVLEIGPGPGALTEEMLRRGADVYAIEKDPRFARALSRLGTDHLQIFESDFLTFPLEELRSHAPMKVIANLPYHIASPILEKLCSAHSLFSSAYVMVQREMAERIVARKGTKEMGSFTVFLKMYAEASIAVKVSRHCFYPAPKVDSSVVKLDFRLPPLADPAPFFTLVRRAFQQRRKMLRSTLSIREEPYASLRPEALSFEDWLLLYQKYGSTATSK